LSIELSFLSANLSKFPHGGYVTLIVVVAVLNHVYLVQKPEDQKSYVEFVRLETIF
jgi:KUP system potassium uptake protein